MKSVLFSIDLMDTSITRGRHERTNVDFQLELAMDDLIRFGASFCFIE